MIPQKLYNQIVKQMPITSVEAIIKKDNTLLFLKRNNPPAKDEWWFPGGRIRKGETHQEALIREINEETSLKIEVVRFVGVYTRIFPNRHDITLAFLCKCHTNKVILNDEHSKYKFLKNPPKNIHPFLLQTIQDSKWNYNHSTQKNKLKSQTKDMQNNKKFASKKAFIKSREKK